MFNIIGDNYTTFRINNFIDYYNQKHYTNDSDIENLKSLIQFDKDDNTKVWLSFLFSTCYSVATTALMYQIFPSIEFASEINLKSFWKTYKDKLIFQSDRRYVKNNDKFIQIVLDYKSKFESISQKDLIASLFNKDKPAQFIYDWFTTIYYCGRFSSLLFLEAIYGMFDKPLTECINLHWKSCKTCAQGLAVLLYEDDWALELQKRDPSKEEEKKLDYTLQKVFEFVRTKLTYEINFARLVGYLCSYFKLYKQSRYLEYYTDRRLEELLHYKQCLPEFNSIWNYLFKRRYDNVPHEILGELNGWSTIRKERCKDFINHGKF